MVPAEASQLERRRGIWTAVVVLALVVLAATGWWMMRSPPAAPRFETAVVERGEIISRVTATGILSATVTVEVGAQITGRLAEVLVDFNDSVKKGQLLARIDAATFEAAVAEAKANLASAEANHARAIAREVEASKQQQRATELSDRGLIATADVDAATAAAVSAKADVQAAQSAIAQARATVERAQTNLSYTRILSPIDGSVLSRNIDVGQTVAASLQAPVLFTLVGDLKKMQVEASVSEADIGRVVQGQETSFGVDAYPGDRFKGVVLQVRNAPTTVSNVVTYAVVIDVDNSELKLKPGMTANVTFTVEQKDDVLRLPQAALRYRPPNPDKAGADRAPADRAPADRAPADRAPADRAGADKVSGDKPGADKVSADRASADKVAADTASTDKASTDRGPKPGRTVWVLRGAEPEKVVIETGLSDGSFTEVKAVQSGTLEVGDRVITSSLEMKKAGGSSSLVPMGGPPGGSGGRRGF